MTSALIFAMLYQSLHIYEHLAEDHEIHSTISADYSKTSYHKDHSSHDQCFACDFVFSTIYHSDQINYVFIPVPYFYEQNIIFDQYFTSNLFQTSYIPRGPPAFYIG